MPLPKEWKNGKEDQDENAKEGKPHRRKDTAKQPRTRLDPLDDPRLRFLCDSYQGSANLRSFFKLRRAVRFLLARFGCWLSNQSAGRPESQQDCSTEVRIEAKRVTALNGRFPESGYGSCGTTFDYREALLAR